MPKKWHKLLNMRKLTEKQIIYCKYLVKNKYKIKDICSRYWVSPGYLYYYWIRKKG